MIDSERHARLVEARDVARQMVTAILHGDRGKAIELSEEFWSPELLCLVLADQESYVHQRWAEALGIDAKQAWAALMLDIEEHDQANG